MQRIRGSSDPLSSLMKAVRALMFLSWCRSSLLMITVLLQHPSCSGVHLQVQVLLLVPVCFGVGFGATSALQVLRSRQTSLGKITPKVKNLWWGLILLSLEKSYPAYKYLESALSEIPYDKKRICIIFSLKLPQENR